MPNQIAKDKRRVTYVLPKSLVERVSGRAAEDGTTRTAVVTAALEAYLSPVEPPVTRADLEAIARKLGELEEGREKTVQALKSAIESQPIAVQQALPEADEDWREKRLIDRILKR